MTLTRRDTLAFGAAATALAFVGVPAAFAQAVNQVDMAKLMAPDGLADHVLGPQDAKVTVIEYASPTCPHCATFHNTVYPEFKAQYIDTGKVKFIVRPFVRNVLDAVVFMLAEAAGPEKYHTVVDTYFRTQEQWSTAENPREAILAIAKQLGFTEESFNTALENQALFTGMESVRKQALDQFGLTGTPTFYVNGKQLTGESTLEGLAAEIDPLLPAGAQPSATPAAQEPAVAPANTNAGASTPVQ